MGKRFYTEKRSSAQSLCDYLRLPDERPGLREAHGHPGGHRLCPYRQRAGGLRHLQHLHRPRQRQSARLRQIRRAEPLQKAEPPNEDSPLRLHDAGAHGHRKTEEKLFLHRPDLRHPQYL